MEPLKPQIPLTVREPNADLDSVDALMAAFCAAISFTPGGEPDWNRFRSFFAPGARLTQATPEGLRNSDIETFIYSYRSQVRGGVYTHFHEIELARHEDRFDRIAQVFSSFEATIGVPDRTYKVRGMHSFQLVHYEERWVITAILWNDENPATLLPPEFEGNHRGAG